VTGFVPNPAIAPLGKPETLKVTGELKLSIESMITVVVPEEPCATFKVEGEVEIEKSLTANTFT
jgi:hypothetical protein